MEKYVIRVAFFKGNKKSVMHRFIRWYTGSPYSHAELVLIDGTTWVSISPFYSSKLEAQVHPIINKEEWDFIDLNLSWRTPVRQYQLSQLNKFIDMTLGSKYDWAGMILSHLSPYVIKHKKKWYCSEWIAHALVYSRVVMWDDMNLHHTPDLSPGKLHAILSKTAENDVYK